MQTSFIFLKEVRFHAFHGVMPQEKAVGADFLVSLRVGFNIRKAMRSDDVSDTVSYADLYDIVKREMMQPSALLEHVAGRIVEGIKREFSALTSVDLSITKINPPMGADCLGAGIELHLEL